MKVAFITPWPPQATGIGDYTYDLVAGLQQLGLSISVFTDAKEPRKIEGVSLREVKEISKEELANYDVVVFQMGNNTQFHLYMIDMIKEFGGIVHLHDMVLHHIMAWTTWMQGNSSAYMALIEKWYGKDIAELCERMMQQGRMPWDSELVTEIPLCEEVIQYADMCIVHSNFAKRFLKTALPQIRVSQIDQVYQNLDIKVDAQKPRKKFQIGVFGGVDPQKHVELVIESLANLYNSENIDFTLHIVGSVAEGCRDIVDLTKQLGIAKYVKFHGRVNEARFHELMQCVDLMVALRFPTMGETSAVVMKAMQLGIPVVVNDIGWYSELPDFVVKLEVSKTLEQLTTTLNRMLTDDDYYQTISGKTRAYANDHLSFDKVIQDYAALLKKSFQHRQNKLMYEKLGKLWGDMGISSDDLCMPIISKLQQLF